MPAHDVIFIDTSVLTNLLSVPGLCDRAEEAKGEFERLRRAGGKFVIPVTALIETGNHIAQVKQGDRRGVAQRFCKAVDAARSSSPPWTIRDVNWDDEFLVRLLSGDSTGSALVEHLAAKTLGTGDVAILVERDLFLEQVRVSGVRIWSYDQRLVAYNDVSRRPPSRSRKSETNKRA